MASPNDWWYLPVVNTAATNAFTYNTGVMYGANTTYPQTSGAWPQQPLLFVPQPAPLPAVSPEEPYPEIAQLRRRIADVTQLVAA